MVGQVMSLLTKDVHTLNPGICEYVTLHSKRDFEDLIVRGLKIERLSWIIHAGPI